MEKTSRKVSFKRRHWIYCVVLLAEKVTKAWKSEVLFNLKLMEGRDAVVKIFCSHFRWLEQTRKPLQEEVPVDTFLLEDREVLIWERPR